ncbi:MarR family winged helix-turn-helix transcriptional regulator [Pseudooceanicola sp. 200-1SW]|uniref:MarR family winged helix-turn-helix transcriptional regulator n=1 Tax=Pseudooceanicola sp. 200-1SW TaxID=3425949 RepID=UPI003D7F4015
MTQASDPSAPSGPDVPLAATEALLCFNLYAASHAFIRLYAPYLDKLSLTYPQFLVLLLLHGQDGQGVGELGRALSMETNTLSPLLKRMQAAGLLDRVRSTTDERRVEIRLTETGRARAAAAAEVPGCIARDGGLSEDSYHQSLATLRALRRQIAETEARARARAQGDQR